MFSVAQSVHSLVNERQMLTMVPKMPETSHFCLNESSQHEPGIKLPVFSVTFLFLLLSDSLPPSTHLLLSSFLSHPCAPVCISKLLQFYNSTGFQTFNTLFIDEKRKIYRKEKQVSQYIPVTDKF